MPRTKEEIKRDLNDKVATREVIDDEINALRAELARVAPLGWVVLTSPPNSNEGELGGTFHPIGDRILFLANHGIKLRLVGSREDYRLEVSQYSTDSEEFERRSELGFGQSIRLEDADEEDDAESFRACGYTVGFFSTYEAAEVREEPSNPET